MDLRIFLLVFITSLTMQSKAVACSSTLLSLKEFSVCLPSDTEIAHRIEKNEFHVTVIDPLRGTTGFILSKSSLENNPLQFDEPYEDAVSILGLNESKCLARNLGPVDTVGEDVFEVVFFSLNTRIKAIFLRENLIYEQLLRFCKTEA